MYGAYIAHTSTERITGVELNPSLYTARGERVPEITVSRHIARRTEALPLGIPGAVAREGRGNNRPDTEMGRPQNRWTANLAIPLAGTRSSCGSIS